MAQSGYTPILIYASGTTTNTPLAANMTSSSSGAELALNYADGKLFYKDSGGVIQVLATKATGTIGGSNTQVQYNSSGSLAGSSNMTFDGTKLTVAGFKDSALTSGRVTYATTSGELTDSANLTFNGTTLTANTIGAFTLSGTIAGGGNQINNVIIGTSNALAGTFTTLTATADSTFSSTGALLISKGTTGQQPGSPVTGMLRYNTTTNQFEGYSGSSPAWNPVGGASISNDTSTSSNIYPILANATSGTATTVYTSNAKLLYKPSTGEFQASALLATNGIILNNTTVADSYTIATGYNGYSVGPVTVNSGVTVTISSGQRWLIQ
jgi:hypothetical protein